MNHWASVEMSSEKDQEKNWFCTADWLDAIMFWAGNILGSYRLVIELLSSDASDMMTLWNFDSRSV